MLNFYTGTLKDRYGWPKRWLSSITYKNWSKHFNGEHTYYFTGATNAPYVLAMLDIDCHAKGTYAGAVNCAEYPQTPVLPQVFSMNPAPTARASTAISFCDQRE